MLSFVKNALPNVMIWLLLLFFLFLWAAARRKRNALKWGLVFLAALWIICTRPAAESFLRPLEGLYTPPAISELREKGVRQVVVLTGGGYDVQDEMLSSALPHGSMFRFVGGLELCGRLGPECRVIFSGTAGGNDGAPTASHMEELARVLSPDRRVASEAQSGSTSEHAVNVRDLVGKESFALVTSAYHMPRSIKVFRKAGLQPTPYPVDFLVRGHYGWTDLLPSAESLWKLQIGLHEYVGLLYYAIRGI